MSRTRFLFTFTLLVSVGLFGVWLGFQTRDPSDPKMLLGPLLVLVAGVGLLTAFRRELREPESEKRAEWEHTKAQGKRRHVLGQVGLGVLYWVLLLLSSLLVEAYRGDGSWGAALRHLGSEAAFGALIVSVCCLWALVWWSYQERKYRGVP